MTKKYLVDLAERVGLTFAEAFLAVFTLTDVSTVKSAAVAGGAAVLSLLKGVVAKLKGDKESASLAA